MCFEFENSYAHRTVTQITDTEFFFQSRTQGHPSYPIENRYITYGNTTENWTNYIDCPTPNCMMIQSSAAANADKSIVYSLSGFDSHDFDVIFIPYNMADGTIGGPTYQIDATCTNSYELFFLNNILYGIATCTNDHLIIYNITADSFSFYEFSSTITIRSIVYEPYYSRLILIGDVSSTSNYVAKSSAGSITDIPDLSASTIRMTSLEDGYAYHPYGLTVIGPTSYTQRNISLSTSTLTPTATTKSYSSDIVSNTTAYTNTSLIEETYYEMDVNITCSLNGDTSITYELVSYNGSTVPSWISLDDANSKLTGTTEDIEADTQYMFALNATANGTTYQKVITLEVSYVPVVTPPVVTPPVVTPPVTPTGCPNGYMDYPHTDE